jgi:hypothetical protein
MSAAPSRNVETPLFLLIFLSGVFTGFRAHRDDAALTRRRGRNAQNLGDTILNTTLADVPRNAECAERRASAPAWPRRATA